MKRLFCMVLVVAMVAMGMAALAEISKNKSERYEVAATMELTGGKVIAAKDECSNTFAGVDLVEAKLAGQIRRYKLEVQPHRQKRSLKNLFIRRK